jgi:hypothetical protein
MGTRKQRQTKAAKLLTDNERTTLWMALGEWYDRSVDNPPKYKDELSPADTLELMNNLCPFSGHWLQNEPTRWDELDDATIKELTERRNRREKIIAEGEGLNGNC